MAGALGTSRMRAARESKLGRYLLYAVGEVLLIFVGITLAVAFDDSSDRRRQEELTLGLLADIRESLEANVVELEMNLAVDSINLASIALVVAHLSTSATWADSLDVHLARARHWTSPFLATSGYESLKQNGLHLVSAAALRTRIIGLFENSYGRLVGDIDRNMWVYMGSVMYPYQSRELVRSDSGGEVLRARVPGLLRYQGARRAANDATRTSMPLEYGRILAPPSDVRDTGVDRGDRQLPVREGRPVGFRAP